MAANTKQKGAPYSHPNFLIVREAHKAGTISAGTSGSEMAGSTLRTYTKSLVVGVTIIGASGGSVGGSVSIGVCRVLAGTRSCMQTEVVTYDKGASALNTVTHISLTEGFTVTSAGDHAVLTETSATLADKCIVLKDVIWRYRILPSDLDGLA